MVQVLRMSSFGLTLCHLKAKNHPKLARKEVPRRLLEVIFQSIRTFQFSTILKRVRYPYPHRSVIYLTFLEYPKFVLGNYPVVNVGNSENPSYLPAEACELLPGQVVKRRLDGNQTKEMLDFACRRPWLNGDSIVGDGKAVLGLNAQNDVLVRSSYTSYLYLLTPLDTLWNYSW